MAPFAKIVKDIKEIIYFQKAPSQMTDCVINARLCSEHINNYFNWNYLSNKSETENDSS